MEKGTTLLTKDGRKMGNAVILAKEPHVTFGVVYKIKTDFGHCATMTEKEIDGLFFRGEPQNLSRRFRDQKKLMNVREVLIPSNRAENRRQ